MCNLPPLLSRHRSNSPPLLHRHPYHRRPKGTLTHQHMSRVTDQFNSHAAHCHLGYRPTPRSIPHSRPLSSRFQRFDCSHSLCMCTEEVMTDATKTPKNTNSHNNFQTSHRSPINVPHLSCYHQLTNQNAPPIRLSGSGVRDLFPMLAPRMKTELANQPAPPIKLSSTTQSSSTAYQAISHRP